MKMYTVRYYSLYAWRYDIVGVVLAMYEAADAPLSDRREGNQE
jgi:hypothetical protein